MKILNLAIAFASLSPSFAIASTFTCTNAHVGDVVEIEVSNVSIRALAQNADMVLGDQDLSIDPSYKPRATHAGALRYAGRNSCGPFDFIIDAKMAAGTDGHATWAADCDSDGTGPSFEIYQCKAK